MHLKGETLFTVGLPKLCCKFSKSSVQNLRKLKECGTSIQKWLHQHVEGDLMCTGFQGHKLGATGHREIWSYWDPILAEWVQCYEFKKIKGRSCCWAAPKKGILHNAGHQFVVNLFHFPMLAMDAGDSKVETRHFMTSHANCMDPLIAFNLRKKWEFGSARFILLVQVLCRLLEGN